MIYFRIPGRANISFSISNIECFMICVIPIIHKNKLLLDLRLHADSVTTRWKDCSKSSDNFAGKLSMACSED